MAWAFGPRKHRASREGGSRCRATGSGFLESSRAGFGAPMSRLVADHQNNHSQWSAFGGDQMHHAGASMDFRSDLGPFRSDPGITSKRPLRLPKLSGSLRKSSGYLPKVSGYDHQETALTSEDTRRALEGHRVTTEGRRVTSEDRREAYLGRVMPAERGLPAHLPFEAPKSATGPCPQLPSTCSRQRRRRQGSPS